MTTQKKAIGGLMTIWQASDSDNAAQQTKLSHTKVENGSCLRLTRKLEELFDKQLAFRNAALSANTARAVSPDVDAIFDSRRECLLHHLDLKNDAQTFESLFGYVPEDVKAAIEAGPFEIQA